MLKIVGLEKVSLEVKLYRGYYRRLARRGFARKLSETPTAYAQRLGRELPAEAENAAAVADLYLRLRYGKEGGTGTQIKRLRWLCGR